MVSMQWIGHLEYLAYHKWDAVSSAEYVNIIHLQMESRQEWKACCIAIAAAALCLGSVAAQSWTNLGQEAVVVRGRQMMAPTGPRPR